MADRDLHPLEMALLSSLGARGEAWDDELIGEEGLPDEGSYRRASQWLISRGLVDETSVPGETRVELGPLGQECMKAGGTPELLLLEMISAGVSGLPAAQADPRFEPSRWGSALGALVKAGLVSRDGSRLSASGTGPGVFGRIWETVYSPLASGGTVVLEALDGDVAALVSERSPKRGRGRAEFVLSTSVRQKLGLNEAGRAAFERARNERIAGQLTPAMLADGSWRGVRFRRYDTDIPAARMHSGRLHPYRVFLDSIRRKLVALGFSEMKGSIAESEFRNCDALFMPQFHPARDIHDAYFLDTGGRRFEPAADILARVAAAHRNGGGTGSRGWNYEYDESRAGLPVLRSQGTALSARCLASGPRSPGRYFAIARCFRYDQVDATHLPDFFQIEGIVLGEGTNLRHLVGLLRLFATQFAGAGSYRLYPGYFPFTEPSVEMHILHPSTGWMEMGGAGLFRPEVTGPLGVDVPVIAWGLGLDRMAMTAMGLSDIRDLMTDDIGRLRAMRVRPERMPGGGGGAPRA